MYDGFKGGNGIVLSTESFTLAEVELLKKVLVSKFELIVTIQNRKTGQLKELDSVLEENYGINNCQLIIPYIIPSMIYKLGL